MSHRPDRCRNRLPAVLVVSVALAGCLWAARAAGAEDSTSVVRLDAEETVRRALGASHAARAAARRVAAARAGVAAADAGRLPTLAASASAEERSSVPELTIPLGPGGTPTTIFPDIRTVYGLGLDLDQTLYSGGSVAAARRASRHELAASRADQESTHVSVALAARLSYWRAAADRAVVDAAHAQLERAEKLSTDARSRRREGLAVDADVLAAQARAASAHLAVVRATTKAEDALAALRSLLDLPAGTPIELADALPASVPAKPAALADLEAAARQRPEIAALAARVEAASARASGVRAAARPRLGANLGWDLARPNPRYLPLRDEWNDSWRIGIAARWSLWDGGRTAAQEAGAEAEQGALAEQLAETERRVDLEVEQARLALSAALVAVDAADAVRQAAAARLTAEEDRYRAGLATTTDVLDAQSDLATAEADQVTARTDAWMAAARLDRAVGR